MRTVGEILKEARLKRGVSLDEVEKATKIRKKFLESLESGDWDFSTPIVAKGLLKNYATFLALDEKRILAFFRREYDEKKAVITNKPPKTSAPSKFHITPAFVTSFVIGLIVLGILSYLYFQYQSFTSPPELEIQEPKENVKVTSSDVNVVGRTWNDATVKVNGEQIDLDPGGVFSVSVGLKEGINKLTITSANRFGKISTVTRTVVVEPTEPKVASVDNKKVSLMLKIIKTSTFVSVEEDGETVFEGLILAGSVQEFSAEEKIKINSENGGTTQVVFNGKETTLGEEGERAEREFRLDQT